MFGLPVDGVFRSGKPCIFAELARYFEEVAAFGSSILTPQYLLLSATTRPTSCQIQFTWTFPR